VTARTVRSDPHLSDFESLMLTLERDPHLASGFANVTFLDRPADLAQMRARLLRGAAEIPQLRQKVVAGPLRLAPPRWVDDPDFAIERHVRKHTLAGTGDVHEVIDLAMDFCHRPYDPAHPMWEFLLVDGLADGRGAMVQRLHHTLTDGVGAVRMSEHFIDLERDARIPRAKPFPESAPVDESRFAATVAALDHAARRTLGAARRSVGGAGDLATHPDRLTGALRSTLGFSKALVNEATAFDKRRSPLWTTRSLDRTLRLLQVPLDDIRRVAKAHDASINDLFVAGAAGGAGAYHRACGVPIHELRMAMPVNTRTDRSEAGNAFGMARLLVPTGADPLDRLGAVHERLSGVRGSASVSLAQSLAGPANLLPAIVLVRTARSQVSSVDFTSSNVRGAPFPLYLGGARIESNHPIGPLVGTAFNLTTLSYDGSLDMGLHIDTGAIERPDLLGECVQAAFDELLTA
jgi:WS/DGAT/MGAT family acyltransferase